MVEARDTNDTIAAARRVAILEAATPVFLRYGFKKTSMDDLARAAGLSRQGLYLHFPTKEALFKEGLQRIVETTRAAAKAALAREDQSVDARILGAFEAMHGHAIGQPGAENMNELMETANSLLGSIIDDTEEGFVADIARVLRSSGLAAAWKDAAITTKELAEMLVSTSYGIKHRVPSHGEYRAQMRVAVQLVCSRLKS